jgi:hypothetical protein
MQKAPPILSPGQKIAPTSGLAVASLVLGGLGLCCLLFLFTSIPAVICGHVALRRIRASAGSFGGRGLAIGGLAAGYVGIVLSVIALAAGVFILKFHHFRSTDRSYDQYQPQPGSRPEFLRRGAFQNRASTSTQDAACIANLHQINMAKEMWAMDNRKTGTDEPTQADLVGPGKYLKAFPTCPTGGAYTIGKVETPAQCSQPGHAIP